MILSTAHLCPHFTFDPEIKPEPGRYTVLVLADYTGENGYGIHHTQRIFKHLWEESSLQNISGSLAQFDWKYPKEKELDDYRADGFSLLYVFGPPSHSRPRLQNSLLPGKRHHIGVYTVVVNIMQALHDHYERNREKLKQELIFVREDNRQFVYTNFFYYQLNRFIYAFSRERFICNDSKIEVGPNYLDVYVNGLLSRAHDGIHFRFNLDVLSFGINVDEDVARVLWDNFNAPVLTGLRPFPTENSTTEK